MSLARLQDALAALVTADEQANLTETLPAALQAADLRRYARGLRQKRWDDVVATVPLAARVIPELGARYDLWLRANPPLAQDTVMAPGAAEALQMRLVGQVVPATDHMVETLKLAGEIADNAPLAIDAAKVAVVEMTRYPESADMARLEALAAACFDSEDYKEGQRAFLDKRKPVFRGR